MGFKEQIEEQTNKLAVIYKTTKVLRVITNINSVFLGCLLIYMMMVGFGGYTLAITFAMFILNVSFFAADHFTNKNVRIFK